MAGLNDFPELKAVFDQLMAEKDAIEQQSSPWWERYHALQSEMSTFQEEMRTIADEIKAIERPRLGEIANQLSAIARGTGGRSTSQSL